MMKSPLKLTMLIALTCFFVAFTLNLSKDFVRPLLKKSVVITPSTTDLDLAHYFVSTGRLDDAITEYDSLIPKLAKPYSDNAKEELKNLIQLQDNILGQIMGYISYAGWFVPSRLYVIGGIFLLVGVIFIILRIFIANPLILFSDFNDFAELGVNENFSRAIIDRIREIDWRIKTIQGPTNILADNLEVPIIGMIGEAANIDVLSVIEAAFAISTGMGNLPLSKMTSSRLWFEQPKFLVSGTFEKSNESLVVRVLLTGYKSKKVEQSWISKLPTDSPTSKIIDSIIYPLLFQFNQNIGTNNWEAFMELFLGIEYYLIFTQQSMSFLDNIQNARLHIERSILLDPNYVLAKYNLGFILLSGGDYEGARKLFREVADSTKDSYIMQVAEYNYGVALFQLSQEWAYQKAVEVFHNLLENIELNNKIPNNLGSIIRSTLASAYSRLAIYAKKDKSEFIDLAIKEADIILNDPKSPREARANALIAKGQAYYVTSNFERAIIMFKTALQENQFSVAGWLGLGETYLAKEMKNEGILAFQEVTKLSPFSEYANYKLGNIYRELKDQDTAIVFYKRALRLGVARVALGKIYLGLGLLLEALEEFRQAIKLNRRLSEAWVNIAWVILEMNDPALLPEAVKSARRALQLEKNQSQLWHRHAILAKCLIELEKPNQAYKEALRSVELNPNKAQAYYYLAQVQQKLGLIQSAMESINKVLETDLENGEWRLLANVLKDKLANTK